MATTSEYWPHSARERQQRRPPGTGVVANFIPPGVLCLWSPYAT